MHKVLKCCRTGTTAKLISVLLYKIKIIKAMPALLEIVKKNQIDIGKGTLFSKPLFHLSYLLRKNNLCQLFRIHEPRNSSWFSSSNQRTKKQLIQTMGVVLQLSDPKLSCAFQSPKNCLRITRQLRYNQCSCFFESLAEPPNWCCSI